MRKTTTLIPKRPGEKVAFDMAPVYDEDLVAVGAVCGVFLNREELQFLGTKNRAGKGEGAMSEEMSETLYTIELATQKLKMLLRLEMGTSTNTGKMN